MNNINDKLNNKLHNQLDMMVYWQLRNNLGGQIHWQLRKEFSFPQIYRHIINLNHA